MTDKLNNLIKAEIRRQELTLDLIPSENIAEPAMLKILASPLVNKYSEGYPGKRYYPGNKFYDEIEVLAQERALRAFHLNPKNWAVNVQAYSGSTAMQAIYFALLSRNSAEKYAEKRGMTSTDIMGLSLSHGGHLTHGHKVNFSGIVYNSIPYTLNLDTGFIDYKNLEKLARKYKPRIIVSGATAYPREIDFRRIGEITRNVNAYHVADISHIAGLIAAHLHPSPFPHAHVVMATTHKTLRGPRGAVIFARKSQLKIQIPNSKLQKKSKSQIQTSKLTIAEAIDRAVFPGLQGGPHNNVTAAIAWVFKQTHTAKFRNYERQVVKNAKILASSLISSGFNLVSHGTDNHLMLVDLKGRGISGTEAERMLEASGIIANRNSVPGDAKAFNPSGIRIGTTAVTARGLRVGEMEQIAELIYKSLILKQNVKRSVSSICKRFPLTYKL